MEKNLKKIIVITRGNKGSLVIKNDQVVEFGIEKNLNVIDLTGAGDLFAAGFLHGYINNFSLKRKFTKKEQNYLQKLYKKLVLDFLEFFLL